MASDYGRNFGFRRSDESMWTGREGRLKVPDTGAFLQGHLVTFDASAAGYMKFAAANAPIEAGITGLVIQEDVWDADLHANQVFNSAYLNVVKNSRLAVICTGAGLKVWMKNTPSSSKVGQPTYAAVTMVTFSGITLGELIKWDGTKYVHTTDATNAVARVTATDGTAYLEAVLLK